MRMNIWSHVKDFFRFVKFYIEGYRRGWKMVRINMNNFFVNVEIFVLNLGKFSSQHFNENYENEKFFKRVSIIPINFLA